MLSSGICQRYPYPLICCSVYKEYILICLQPFEGETTSLRVWYLRYGNSNVHFIQPIPTPPVDRMNRSYSEIVTAPTHSYSCTYNKSSLPSDLFPSNSFPLNWQCLPILKNPPPSSHLVVTHGIYRIPLTVQKACCN